MTMPKYQSLKIFLKENIQSDKYKIGDYLPSENDLCKKFEITRTTARRALDELLHEGFIEKIHGKGSRVKERRKSLGLLSVKGFSEAVGENVNTVFMQKPCISAWSNEIQHKVDPEMLNYRCVFFERLRFVGTLPVMHEKNWFPDCDLPGFISSDFISGSFFKTLSQKYLIEVIGSSSELRAEFVSKTDSELFKISKKAPILHISMVFHTSNPKLNIYSELYCNTQKFPVGNHYHL